MFDISITQHYIDDMIPDDRGCGGNCYCLQTKLFSNGLEKCTCIQLCHSGETFDLQQRVNSEK